MKHSVDCRTSRYSSGAQNSLAVAMRAGGSITKLWWNHCFSLIIDHVGNSRQLAFYRGIVPSVMGLKFISPLLAILQGVSHIENISAMYLLSSVQWILFLLACLVREFDGYSQTKTRHTLISTDEEWPECLGHEGQRQTLYLPLKLG